MAAPPVAPTSGSVAAATTPPDPVDPTGGSAPIGGPMAPARFAAALAVVVAAGLAVRVAYVLLVTRHPDGKVYDSFWYYATANGLHQGHFFQTPFGTAPTAAHPPMTSLLLGGASFVVGLHNGPTVALFTMAAIGTGVVAVVGLLGRAVAGPWIGLTSAGLAAVVPNVWMPSGILMSETPTMLFTALLLLAVVHLLRRPSVVTAALVGAACGGVALCRAELIAFVPALLVPAALTARSVSLGRRLGLLGVGLLATAVVVTPWVGRNLAAFDDPTTISTGTGLALLGANCPQTYSTPDLGSWSLQCATSVTGPGDESVQAARQEHAALRYADHHLDRLPVVVLARIGREWDVYQPAQMVRIEANEGRPEAASWAGLVVYYALVPLGVAGVVMLRRRRIAQWFLLVPAGVVTVVAALFYGLVRFRAPFEVCLVVLAAPPLVVTTRSLVTAMAGGRRSGRASAPSVVH